MTTVRTRPGLGELRSTANAIRRRNLEIIHAAGLGHTGGDLSAADILTALYFAVLEVDPAQPDAPERDRYIQSKGHASGVLYTTLAAAGFIPDSLLDAYMAPGSALNGHPDRKRVPGVETNTGPLGHGLPVAVGTAIAAKLDRSRRRSNWEAIMAAAHHGLDNLVLIVDRNRLQQGARTEDTNGLDPLDAKLAAFGWSVREIDGNDIPALLEVFDAVPFSAARPSAVIANTIKGRGVSFMEDRVEWHHKVPTAEELDRALRELSA
jgi:transketolase